MTPNPLGPFDFSSDSVSAAPETQEMSFTLHQLIDRYHRGLVVSAFEYPQGWQARSEVVWNYQNVSLPIMSRAQAFDPQGAALMDFHPMESFCWLEPNYGYTQPGQPALGQIMMPPMPTMDAMMRLVLPKLRGGRPGMRLVGGGPVPDLMQRLGQSAGPVRSEDICVKIEYVENGRPVEEEFYASRTQNNIPYYGPQGMTMQVNWGFERLFSFREEKGQLEARREIFWHIARSLHINPDWERLYTQITQELGAQFNQYIQAGYSQIQAAGQISRAISANNDAMLRGFEQQRQAAHIYSRNTLQHPSTRSATDGFDEYIRGVETVQDPYWGESQQDANYQYHWTDGYGNYQQSNDVFFNPNFGSNQTWTMMEPKG